jgi:Ser/Thr protein kinase RdoA (MazF antagonist)
MKPYKELTRRARLSRMRKLARTALKAYGLDAARLDFLQYFANIIYRVDAPAKVWATATSGYYVPKRYLLRIHALSDVDAITSELTWLKAISQEAGLPVPAPVMTLDGHLLITVTTPGIPKGRVVSLMHWLDGRSYHKGLKPKHLSALGKVVAQLHNFSAGWQPPTGFSRPNWDWEALLGGSHFSNDVDELVASMPARFQRPFTEVSIAARRLMEHLGKAPASYGMIHGDLYPENVLYKKGNAYPIDFEDCGYGYWMWDIAIALCEWAWGEDWARMRDAFFDGYDRLRSLPEEQWKQLDLFLAIQFATMVQWASAFLKNDPQRRMEHEQLRDRNGAKLLEYMGI